MDSTPKPNFANGQFSSVIKARFRYIDKSEEKENSRYNSNTKNMEQVKEEKPYGMISTIKEVEEDREKGSTLFQGAKSIVSRFIASRKKDHLAHHVIDSSSKKKSPPKISHHEHIY